MRLTKIGLLASALVGLPLEAQPASPAAVDQDVACLLATTGTAMRARENHPNLPPESEAQVQMAEKAGMFFMGVASERYPGDGLRRAVTSVSAASGPISAHVLSDCLRRYFTNLRRVEEATRTDPAG